MTAGSKTYWDNRQHLYPHQIKVPHMSPADIDPRRVPELIGWRHQFLRVPFDGEAHWGFKTKTGLVLFQSLINAPAGVV